MLTLNASQADLANRSSMAAVPLIVLTTYSDRDAETTSGTFYWSVVPCHYDWENTGTNRYFRDVVDDLSPIVNRMPHLSIGGGNQTATGSLRLSLVNELIEGEYL